MPKTCWRLRTEPRMHNLARLAARRLLLLMLTVAGCTVLCALLVRMAPGFGMDERVIGSPA